MSVPEVPTPIVLFDGMCNLCSGSVQFIINRDTSGIFRFAALQSRMGEELAAKLNLPPDIPDSLILVENDKCYFKSTGALRILKRLGFLWKILYIFILVPEPIRDYFYDIVARNRYKWYGKKEKCLVPDQDIKDRFLE